MDYTFHRQVSGTVAEVSERAKEALKHEGFGVLTEIDLAGTLKAKIGADLAAYRILGACNPPLAKSAIDAEPRIGVMLPCNVIVRDIGGGQTEVAAINPAAPMAAIGNRALSEIAEEVGQRLQKAVERI
jgi:uncharacterized protein (DUF302 family)